MPRWPDGYFTKSLPERIDAIGHRAFVGGFSDDLWHRIGKLQYHFLVSNGLRHDQVFYDIGCGSLRLGQFLIPYLDRGHYHGIEQAETLVEQGLSDEFFADIVQQRKPRFRFTSAFEFEGLPMFDMAIAQSVFTHLTLEDIGLCFARLRPQAHDDSRFYFTFFEGDAGQNKFQSSDPNRNWHYRFEDLTGVARSAGWQLEYIGDWQHPAKQRLVLAVPVGVV